jgi:hypothetical protein
MAAPRPPRDDPDRRWILIRDLLVFTVKAGVEAVRDIVMIPVAAVAGLVGLILDAGRPDRLFREMLRLGQRFDDWLDLFGARVASEEKALIPRKRGARFDDGVDAIEKILREQHERGGVTAGAKEAIDRALDSLQRAVGPRLGAGSETERDTTRKPQ